jgi:hypothetical protein
MMESDRVTSIRFQLRDNYTGEFLHEARLNSGWSSSVIRLEALGPPRLALPDVVRC